MMLYSLKYAFHAAAMAVGVAMAAVPAGAADATAGMQKAQACFACHGENGVAVSDEVPHLAAQNAKYIEKQLAAFQAGGRKSAVMNGIAGRVSKDDVADIAAFYAGLPGAQPGAKSAQVAAINASKVPFPKDYKDSFVLYHTINFADRGQVRKYYANRIAADAARAGQPMPAGAVFFTEVFSVKKDADGKPVTGADGFFEPDKLIMHTAMGTGAGWGDAIPALLRNGDWNYGVFSPAGEMRPFNQAACLACHIPQEQESYLFTLKELAAKVKQ